MDVERAVPALGAWLLTYAVHSTVLIGSAWLVAVALARLACRSPRLRDALPAVRDRLWKTALVGGIATASIQTGLGLDPWDVRPALLDRPVARVEAEPDSWRPAAPVGDAPARPPRAVETARAGGDTTRASVDFVSDVARVGAPLPTGFDGRAPAVRAELEGAATRSSASAWIQGLLLLWAAGVLVGLMRWTVQWNRLLRSLDDRAPIESGRVHAIFSALRRRSGSRSRTRLSAAPSIAAPITLGVWHLEICLPPRVDAELQPDEIEALLAHELAHAERADPQWLAVCRLIEVVFFFQPLNRLCASWIQDEAEYLCDDWAVVQIGERVPLAACLTEIAGWIVHEPVPRLAPGMAARGTRLSMRVRRLLDEEHEPGRGRRGAWIALGGASALAASTLLVPGVAAEARVAQGSIARDVARIESAPASGLADRTRELEFALAPRAETTPDLGSGSRPAPADEAPAACAETEPVDDQDELVRVLEDIDLEIEALRHELDERGGDARLAARLDALAEGLRHLFEQHAALACALERALDDAPRMDPDEAPSDAPLSFTVPGGPASLWLLNSYFKKD